MTEKTTYTLSALKDWLRDYIIENYDIDKILKKNEVHLILKEPEHLELIRLSGNPTLTIVSAVCGAITKFVGTKTAHKTNPENPEHQYVKDLLSGKWDQFEKDIERINVTWKCPINNKSGRWDGIHKKEITFDGKDKIDNVVRELQKNHQFVTLRESEEILLYNDKIYDKIQAKAIIKEETEKLIPNCTEHDRIEVVNKIKAQTGTDLKDFDVDPNLITVENGILNLETLELKPHTPEHLSRVLLPVEYNKPKHEINDETIFADIEENLKETLFLKFLRASFTVDGNFRREDFETALEMTACGIIKRHIDEKAFMNLGQGENGKSVLLQYIESLLGVKNISRVPLQDISEDKFLAADLDGMSANIFTDLGKNELRHTGKIKAITSNEGIAAQKKHRQPFTLYPVCKLMFSSNRFPKVYDQTQGFFRRWIIIKWDRNFEKDPERDVHLLEKLKSNQEEKNLVFSCLVSLANRLNKVGKFTHSKDWKTIQKEWNANADPIDDFATNYIRDSETNKTKRETYQFYKEIMLAKGETPLGMGQFSKAFEEYHDQDRSEINCRTERVWLNIDFKRPIQTTLNTVDES